MLKQLKGLVTSFFAFLGYAGDAIEAVVADDAGSLPSEVAPPAGPVTSGYLQLDVLHAISADEPPKWNRAVIVDAPKAYAGRGCKNANGRVKKAYATKAEADKSASKYPGMKSYRCKTHGWHVAHELSRGLRKAVRSAAKTHAKPKKRSSR